MVWGVRHFKGYLEGYRFTIITDHQSLRWLHRLELPTGRLARWLFELQQFDYEVQYRRGTENVVADALSRREALGSLRASGRCPWYHALKRAVERYPERYLDFSIRGGKLNKHVLHDLNFHEVSGSGRSACREKIEKRSSGKTMTSPPRGI